jgi:hypothetical protein
MQETGPSLGSWNGRADISFPRARQCAQFNATECMKKLREDG